MTGRHVLILAGVGIYLFVTMWKWHVLWHSTMSVASFVGALVCGDSSSLRFGSVLIAEYWLALGAWIVGGIVLFGSALRPGKALHGRTMGEMVLLVAGFIALAAPILAPLSPAAQGDPVSTRLLPPLSSGVIMHHSSAQSVGTEAPGFAELYKRSEAYLLLSSDHFAGESALQEGEVSQQPIVFLLGTDDHARDVFSRILFGARVSLGIGLAAALGALCIGTLIGFVAGYGGSLVEGVLMRLTDVFLAVPSLFLVVCIIAFVPSSLFTLIAVLALTGWMSIARTVRAEVMRLRQQEFVLAARLLNRSSWEILYRHILPNLKPLLVTAATIQFSNAILAEASLSFLGLGIQPPTPSWGNMMGEALSYLRNGWWLGVFPGVALALVVVSSHVVAERLTGVER